MIRNTASITEKTGSLAGHLLIATPIIEDSCFARSVIFLCAHSHEGAMGVIVNYPVQSILLEEVFHQLNIPFTRQAAELPVYFGGPVEPNRGFVVHDASYPCAEIIASSHGVAVSASLGILQSLAQGGGPEKAILALGYAGWSPGQLESEIENGSWMLAPASPELVLDAHNDIKWSSAIASLGIDLGHYSTHVGHA